MPAVALCSKESNKSTVRISRSRHSGTFGGKAVSDRAAVDRCNLLENALITYEMITIIYIM